MYIYRNNLHPKFLKDLHEMEDKYPVIIMLEYVGNDVIATFVNKYNLDFTKQKTIGTRSDSEEQLTINMRNELKKIYAYGFTKP